MKERVPCDTGMEVLLKKQNHSTGKNLKELGSQMLLEGNQGDLDGNMVTRRTHGETFYQVLVLRECPARLLPAENCRVLRREV